MFSKDRCYEPEGFTLKPEIREILSKYETIICYGGITQFDALPAREARKLLDLLPPEQRDDRQNLSPTFLQFVELGEKFPGVYFHGYRVSPERSDERITLEGFYAPKEVAEALRRECEYEPDEWEAIDHPQLGWVIRAWWD